MKLEDIDGDLVLCVSRDPVRRRRLARRLDDFAVVLICPDLETLRNLLRPAATDTPAITRGELVIDRRVPNVTWRGDEVPLTRLERELLARLAADAAEVWAYERLYREVWGGGYLGDTAVLHAAVKRLRRKLKDAGVTYTVETVRGVGYRLAG